MRRDDPKSDSDQHRIVLERNLDNANGRLASLNAEHRAAARMTGDRRNRTLRGIEEKIRETTRYRDGIIRDLQNLKPPPKPSAPRLNYRSELKRAVSVQLTRKPDAADLEICRALDDAGAVELPASMTDGVNRLFEYAYKGRHRHKLEITISRVRTDMRAKGLIPHRSR